jgi:hypothetical protein
MPRHEFCHSVNDWPNGRLSAVVGRIAPAGTSCRVETTLSGDGEPGGMVQADPVLVGIVIAMLIVVFAVYLFLRRIATGFKKGLQQGKGRN